jgi:hypothetical protein
LTVCLDVRGLLLSMGRKIEADVVIEISQRSSVWVALFSISLSGIPLAIFVHQSSGIYHVIIYASSTRISPQRLHTPTRATLNTITAAMDVMVIIR